ncbi:anti-sigma factor [Gemmatimonas sp.]|uniref:anti-sigma factor domain-containing protein n=1 Tax=Gemmatimonas sp. TaxID=1962908 RepID=UPI00286B25D2|nr:anti-sigma factor [Gemmatimonas sp.]
MNDMTPLTLEQLRDLAPSFALGMLDADERAAFERGLQLPEYRATLERDLVTHRAAAELMATAQPVVPPPGLKARMMERIAAEKRAALLNVSEPSVPVVASVIERVVEPVVEPVVAAIETPRESVTDNVRELAMARRAEAVPATPKRAEAVRQSPKSQATRAVTPPTPTAITELSARRTARTAWWTAGVLGTALAASVVIAVDFHNQAKALEDRASQDNALIVRTEAKLAEREKTLQTLLAGRGNVVLVNLNPAQPAGPGMQVFWNVREGKAVVNAYGLTPVASDRAYMLWMIRDGKPVPLKLFTPGDDGRAIVASVELPTTTSGITLLAVTEESSAGAVAPTMTPFLVGEVPTKGAMQ